MNELDKKPIIVDVDFNNAEEDYAVRLHLPRVSESLKKQNTELVEGVTILMTDGEIEKLGTVSFRDGIWVGIPLEGTLREVKE